MRGRRALRQGSRLLIHLLSPAWRPVAVTDDPHPFRAGPYRQVRAELRGRCPEHA
ncbi:ATP-dependent helicase C-terminal domain-containing protein [uncultured Actinomyces sp.]|uniref:ATP-dependent helicase C-terminal domain-containing protein n=1 Tax=uncultured Actinomyces sp. TaxID=249061 RepID=UPI0037DBF139